MVKQGKKIWTAVMTVLFVLSVGYFALLAPTTAWFYQSYNTSYTFKFGDFDVNYSDPEAGQGEEPFAETVSVSLRDATRFADSSEILFDEVAHVIKVEAANNGHVPADVAVTVEKPSTSDPDIPSWLHYFVYAAPSNTAIVKPNVATSTKGTFKTQIEAMLNGAVYSNNNTTATFTVQEYESMTRDSSPAYPGRDNAESAYETYNVRALSLLNTHNDQMIHFEPSVSKDIYIVFWAEYGQMPANYRAMSSVVSLGSFPVKITMRADPFIPATQTLQLVNNGSSAAEMSLTIDNITTTYTVAANATRSVENLTVGSPYTVVLTNASASLKIYAGTDGNNAPIYVSEITGIVGNQIGRVTVVTPQSGS